MLNITFANDKNSKYLALAMINKTTDDEEYLIDIDTKRRVLTKKGEIIHVDDFGGFRNGSEIFFKNDYVSILEDLEDRGDAR